MFKRIISFLGLAILASAKYSEDAASDLIVDLPGSDDLTLTDMYSGYLTVNDNQNTNIHYWLVESENDPATDPLVFWTNGGPGCSGLIGFMTEQGPFKPNEDGTLRINNYSWNKNASVIFIESPPGVGFSYSDNNVYGDWDTAHINYQAMLVFYERFPSLLTNDFYISGESYGGHYIPTLAQTIVEENESADVVINFKGFFLGNPYTSVVSNNVGTMKTAWGHQVISEPLYEEWESKCASFTDDSHGCLVVEAQIDEAFSTLNPYALDYPVCDSPILGAQRQRMMEWTRHKRLREMGAKEVGPGPYYPCEDNYAVTYLNRKDVQSAIHVESKIWTECSDTLQYNHSDSHTSMVPIYQGLIDGGYGLKLMVYSGDDDTVCATIGTQMWIWDMDITLTSDWAPWTYDNDVYGEQTGGYITHWDGITLATVHGAGHEVPTYKPQAALDLFNAYLFDTLQ